MTNKGMNPKVDTYLAEGCMRCKMGGTPDCKVHNWEEELKKLRGILIDSGLIEELKWSQPCYTFEKRNIVLMSAFKEYCSINFVKGSLLKDASDILIRPGENTQVGRQIRFTNVREIEAMEPILKAYVYEAIEVEKSGLKPDVKRSPEPIPEELQKKFDEVPPLKTAFNDLTPGRQRAYILYFSAPKHSKTRESRIEKCMRKILDGMGIND